MAPPWLPMFSRAGGPPEAVSEAKSKGPPFGPMVPRSYFPTRHTPGLTLSPSIRLDECVCLSAVFIVALPRSRYSYHT
jgi:hypothetical protein